jgi:AraC-like DNA-binding protein
MQVKDISRAVGYDDPFYFCRIFTAAFGVPPRIYRMGES